MLLRHLFGLIVLTTCLNPVEVFGDPRGVWVPANPGGLVTRIHVSGSPLSYTAMIDYRCGPATCSTLQSLVEGDNAPHPSTFSVFLEAIGPAPMLELRWQRGPPCNRETSDENPLAFWQTTVLAASGKTRIVSVGKPVCFLHPPTSSIRR